MEHISIFSPGVLQELEGLEMLQVADRSPACGPGDPTQTMGCASLEHFVVAGLFGKKEIQLGYG